jgi:hypothetical protein
MLIDTSTPISQRRRKRLAKGLRRVVAAAAEPPRTISSAIPVQRWEVLNEQGFILQIAHDLESDEEVSARGVAMVRRLLTDGNSPIYVVSPPGALREALTHAHAALHLA